jgi:hypothetical protein
MSSSIGINRRDPEVLVGIYLERIGGTLIRAKNSAPVSGFLTITAKFNESPDI